MRGLPGRWATVVLLMAALMFLLQPSEASEDHIIQLTIKGTINPGSSDYVAKGLQKALDDHAACVILQLDTPGGLYDAMQDIVQGILNSPVPVIVYVGPSGARAASAGVLITIAGHIAAHAFHFCLLRCHFGRLFILLPY